MGHINFILNSGDTVCICISLSVYYFFDEGDVMSPLRYSHMIASHSKVPVSMRARGCE